MPDRAHAAPHAAIDVAVLQHALHAIAGEMGAALRRAAFSPNIKERRDYSSAVFDHTGAIVAMGDDMPVHLGSMPLSVRAVLDRLTLADGDVAILNDPYAGGTHLPDITLVAPVFVSGARRPALYVANRAHHADIGGAWPGSMGLSREIHQEGLRLPPLTLVRRGTLDRGLLDLILANVRTPAEREGDLTAQLGAIRIGVERCRELLVRFGAARLRLRLRALLDHSERLMRAELRAMPAGVFRATDELDDDGISTDPIRLKVAVALDPRRARARVDFTGSSPQVAGSVNAVYAITYSAVYYVFRCLLPPDAAPTAGLMRPVELIVPAGSVLNARPPAAVAGGNVETSQRVVDVLLRALARALPDRIPAASSGTMSNVILGGFDPRTRRPFAYYETIAGGMGARPNARGLDGVHTHMTNSRNTPVEALEYAYPLRVLHYGYRRDSGGSGLHRGGNGLVREIECLVPTALTLLADRRRSRPYGLAGGGNGQPGTASVNRQPLPGKCNLHLAAGARLKVETPGGGGWGRPLKTARRPSRGK